MSELKVLTADELILLIIAVFFVAILFVGLANYLSQYIETLNDLRRFLCNSDSEEEYRYWKRELRIYRLCIIPFLTPKRVKKLLGFFGQKSE